MNSSLNFYMSLVDVYHNFSSHYAPREFGYIPVMCCVPYD